MPKATAAPESVAGLTFYDLNALLLQTEDVDLLQKWLNQTVAEGILYRALRIHGRLNGVRRQQELSRIRKACSAAQKEAA